MESGRRLFLMLFALGVFFAAVAGTNWLVNPYGVWRAALVDDVFRDWRPGEPTFTAYRVTLDRPATLLVGSSRVLRGMPIPQGYRDGVLNAGLPGASVEEIAGIIKQAARGARLRRVVWGVDFFTFDEAAVSRTRELTARRLRRDPRLLVTETLLSLQVWGASGQTLLRAIAGRSRLPATRFSAIPWAQGLIAAAFAAAGTEGLAATDEATAARQLRLWAAQYPRFRLSPRPPGAVRGDRRTGARQRHRGAYLHRPDERRRTRTRAPIRPVENV